MRSARALRRVFASIIATATAGSTATGLLIACGGTTVAALDGSTDGAQASQDASCRAVTPGDASGPCGHWTVTITGDFFACGFEDSGRPPTLYPSNQGICAALCNGQMGDPISCTLSGDQLSCGYICAVDGRRYDGLPSRRAPSIKDLGSYFARIGFFEASSVHAFQVLESDLARHGVPSHLLHAIQAAAQDEVRHTTMANALAGRFGAVPVSADEPATRALRSLEEIALENAVEGCVREAFGALVAGFQAKQAPSELRKFFSQIHRDETRHAALAFELDHWLMSQLSPIERARVNNAREDAVRALAVEVRNAPLQVLVDRAGHPTAPVSVHLVEAFILSAHNAFAAAAA
jgi:hypothetical protein